jgi:general secretion pathway protein A
VHAGFGRGRPETDSAQAEHGAGRPPYYDWDSRALLSLVLVGLPDLKDRLELRKNRSLYSRIERRLSIGPMVVDDTQEYVRLRLLRAGADREVFTADAITMLHGAAGSSLREIDRMATAALREAARRKKKLVERDVMARVIGDSEPDGG